VAVSAPVLSGGEWGPSRGHARSRGGVFEPEATHCPLWQQGGVGADGHQELGRFAGAMGSYRRSSGDLGVCPGQTQAEQYGRSTVSRHLCSRPSLDFP